MRETPQLFDDGFAQINKLLAYARKHEDAMFFTGLATTANLMKCLQHPSERRSWARVFRDRSSDVPRKSSKKAVARSPRRPNVGKTPKAPRKPNHRALRLRGSLFIRHPRLRGSLIIEHLKLQGSWAFVRIEDKVENPQLPLLKRWRSENLEGGLVVRNVFTDLMAASHMAFGKNPGICPSSDPTGFLGGRRFQSIIKLLAAKPLVERSTKPAIISIESSSSTSGSNIRHILEEIDPEMAEVEKVEEKATQSKAAFAHAVNNQDEGAETKPAKVQPSELGTTRVASEKKDLLDPKGKSPMIEDTTGPSMYAPAHASCASEDLLKPSSVRWFFGEPLTRFGGNLLVNPFSVLVDIVLYDQLTRDGDYSAQGMSEQMIFFQLCSKDLKKKLAMSKARVVRLKDLLEDQDAKLLAAGQQQFEVVDANLKLKSKVEELTVELQALLEDHFVVKEDLRLLEESHKEVKKVALTLQSKAEVVETKMEIIEVQLGFFQDKQRKTELQLREAKGKAQNYLKQLSFASWVRDISWTRGITLGFETFQASALDPTCDLDFEAVKPKEIVPSNEAMDEIGNLGHDFMPEE
ncbi:hypothetical protein FH972_012792 [Carpinus fangiana]|uniref:Uncharacterized protein n=1 Tax=Carpinus fangiana TaxID=176857 RepID=A0A5N6R4S5_9ROSI|nr:hypothetical protein FH972_012792 [Carpinus fangiana]